MSVIVNDVLVLNPNGEHRSAGGGPSSSCRRDFGYLAFNHGDNVMTSLDLFLDHIDCL